MPQIITLTTTFTLLLALTTFSPNFNPINNNYLTLPKKTPFNYTNLPLPLFFNTPPIQNTNNTPTNNPITNKKTTLKQILFYNTHLSINQTITYTSYHKQKLTFSNNTTLNKNFNKKHTTQHSIKLNITKYYPNKHFF